MNLHNALPLVIAHLQHTQRANAAIKQTYDQYSEQFIRFLQDPDTETMDPGEFQEKKEAYEKMLALYEPQMKSLGEAMEEMRELIGSETLEQYRAFVDKMHELQQLYAELRGDGKVYELHFAAPQQEQKPLLPESEPVVKRKRGRPRKLQAEL